MFWVLNCQTALLRLFAIYVHSGFPTNQRHYLHSINRTDCATRMNFTQEFNEIQKLTKSCLWSC